MSLTAISFPGLGLSVALFFTFMECVAGYIAVVSRKFFVRQLWASFSQGQQSTVRSASPHTRLCVFCSAVFLFVTKSLRHHQFYYLFGPLVLVGDSDILKFDV